MNAPLKTCAELAEATAADNESINWERSWLQGSINWDRRRKLSELCHKEFKWFRCAQFNNVTRTCAEESSSYSVQSELWSTDSCVSLKVSNMKVEAAKIKNPDKFQMKDGFIQTQASFHENLNQSFSNAGWWRPKGCDGCAIWSITKRG